MKWINYVVPTVDTPLTQGHLPAEDLEKTLTKYPAKEAYHSVFDLEPRDSYKDYQGLMRPALGLVFFDFDGPEEDRELAHKQAKDFVLWLGIKDVHISFSGNKGFHIGIPQEYLDISPSKFLHKTIRQLAVNLKQKFSTIDTSIYSPAHKIRAQGTLHPKTNQYKMYLSFEDFLKMSFQEIQDKSKLERGEISLNGSGPNPKRIVHLQLLDLLGKVQETKSQENQDPSRFDRFKKFQDKPCVQKLLTEKAKEGDRHEIANIIMSDLFFTGESYDNAQKIILNWARENGLAKENREAELIRYLDSLYSGASNYSFGCNHPHKRKFCTNKCGLFQSLNPDTRPKFKEPETEESETFKSKIPNDFVVQNLKDRIDQVILEPDWVVDQLFPKGSISLVSADPKAGKSTLTRFLAKCIADGEMFLGFKCKESKVLMFAVEEKERFLVRDFKIMNIKNKHNIEYHVATTPSEALMKTEKFIDQFKPDLVIFDTMFKILQTNDENKYAEQAKAISQIQNLAYSHNIHILSVHHNNKGKGEGMGKILGSNAIRGAFDYNIMIDVDADEIEENPGGAVRFIKSEGREGYFFKKTVLKYAPEEKRFWIEGSAKKYYSDKKLEEQLRALKEISKDGEPRTKRNWMDLMKGQKQDRVKMMQQAIEAGLFKESPEKLGGYHIFEITEKVKCAAESDDF